jgi:hypothetical protein
MLLLLCPMGIAQITTADLVGTVTDKSGAVVQNASVTLRNTGTSEIRKAATDKTGGYTFSLLQVGHYDLEVSSPGFKSFQLSDINLAVGERRRADVELSLGVSSETVEVSAEAAPALQTDSATVGSVVNYAQVQDLPLNGRNFINLVQVQPGINAGQPTSISSGNRPDSRRQTSSISANGQTDSYNNNLIDGLDNNERLQGFIGVRPAIDSIEQIRVDTNSYSAEMGRAAGAIVNIITKAGSNNFHGSVYEFFRNDIFNARDAFDNVAGSRKPEYRQNQFGGSLGGPIVRNRTFFFVDAEWFRSIQGMTYTTTVPTNYEQEHPGDMSDYCPNLGTPCAGYPILPTPYLNPIALKYFSLFPRPNRAGFVNNYTSTPNRTQYATTVDARIDHHFSSNDLVFVRYGYNPVDTTVAGAFPKVNGISPGGAMFSYPGVNKEASQNIQTSYVHIFNPNLLLKLQGGYTRINIRSLPDNYGKSVSNEMGLTNANLPGDPTTTGLTPMYFALNDYASLGGGVYQPIYDINNSFQYSGSVNYNRGAHSISFGGSILRRQLNYFQSVFPTGAYVIIPLGLPTLGVNSLPYFLTGTAFQYMRSNVVNRPGYRAWETGAYFQDNWRVNDRLTLNLGIRYEVFTPYTEVHNYITNFDMDTLKIVQASNSNPTANVKTEHGDFSPRIGFAASLNSSTVLRGGFGMSYYPTDELPSNPPSVYNYTQYLVNFSTPAPIPAPVDPNTFATNPNVTLLTTKARNLRPLYVEQFNLALQKQVGPQFFTIGYVGQLGRQLIVRSDLNRPDPPGANQPARPLIYAAQLPYVQQIQNRRNGAISSYNSLQTTYSLQSSFGLNMNVNYTWAHTLTNTGFASANNGLGTTYQPNLLNDNLDYDYGNADTDIRHRVAMTLNYQLPFGKHLTGAAGVLAKGWQLNSLAYWQTGLPITASNTNGQARIPLVTGDRPNVLHNPNLNDPSPRNWFDKTAFELQTPGTLGNSGRNTIVGPRDRRVDLSLFKSFALREPFTLQFRAECYNVTNTPNWGMPNINWQLPNGGTINSTATGEIPRQYQFALKVLF